MSGDFHNIRIKQVEKNTEDCVLVTFAIPDNLKADFAFSAGQYLTLRTEINNEDVRRSYSLCSSPLDNTWQVAIKQIDGGVFSTYANNELSTGDEILVQQPDGRFGIPMDPKVANNYVAFAAGSGITPIVSIISSHLRAEPNSTFKLFYVNKRVSSIILKETLEDLKNEFMDRLEIFYFLTRESRSVEWLNGRLSKEKMERIFSSVCDIANTDHYFSCGPESMIIMIRDFLLDRGVNRDNIHFELFFSGEVDQEKKGNLKKQFEGKTSSVELKEGGKTIIFQMKQADQSILDEALLQNADLPFACKGGVCCTCRAKLVEGKVDMLKSYGLEEDEIADGYILTCQALAVSDKIVVDFDQ